MIIRGATSGAVSGAFGGGLTLFAFISFLVITMPTDASILESMFGLIIAFTFGTIPGFLMGSLMGTLLGVIDKLMSLSLSSSSKSKLVWVCLGILFGGIGGAIFWGVVASLNWEFSGKVLNTSIVGLIFGSISGMSAGPIFQRLYQTGDKIR